MTFPNPEMLGEIIPLVDQKQDFLNMLTCRGALDILIVLKNKDSPRDSFHQKDQHIINVQLVSSLL